MPEWWLCLGYTGGLSMPQYARLISQYAEICVNVPKSVWMAFVLFPYCNPLSTWHVVTYFNVYTLTRSYSLRDYKVVFLKRQKKKDFRLHYLMNYVPS